MALPKSYKDREQAKFVECNNEVAVRTKICQEPGEAIAVVTRGLISDIDYDYYTRVLSGADNEIETWTYRNGGSGGTVVAVVVATYTDSYRDDLVAVERAI